MMEEEMFLGLRKNSVSKKRLKKIWCEFDQQYGLVVEN